MTASALPRVLPLIAIVVTAFMVRLFFVLNAPFWAGDSWEYHRIATNLAAGEGYAQVAGVPTVVRPPVYPLFIAAVYAVMGPLPGYVLLAQAAVGAAGAGLVYFLGRSLFRPRIAFAGAFLAACFPQLAFYSASVLSETLAAFLLAATMLAAHHACAPGSRLRTWVGAGVLSGLCVLSTPYLIGIPLAVAGLALVRRIPRPQVARGLAALLVGFLAVYAPWPVRNQVELGKPIPLTVGQSGISFWSAAAHIPMYDYEGVFVDGARREPLVARWNAIYGGPIAGRSGTLAEQMDLDQAFIAEGLRLIREDPLGFIAYRLRMAPRHWIQPAVFAAEHSFRPPFESQNMDLASMIATGELGAAVTRAGVTVVFTGLLWAGFVVGAWSTRRRWRELAVLYAPAVAAIVFQAPFWLEFRYSVSSQQLLWLVSAAGLATAIGWLRPHRTAPKDEYLDRTERRPGVDGHAVAE